MVSVRVLGVWPKMMLPPTWPRDAERVDTSAPDGPPQLGALILSSWPPLLAGLFLTTQSAPVSVSPSLSPLALPTPGHCPRLPYPLLHTHLVGPRNPLPCPLPRARASQGVWILPSTISPPSPRTQTPTERTQLDKLQRDGP